ncbi:MAG: hypothetical protein APR62_10015 [Smithella sp. SDB]|nr:MAG: hypothetical protein APR62_10015 [Smithella sp. SDB]
MLKKEDTGSENKKYIYLIIILLIVSCSAAFGRIAGNDFINLDDTGYITENYHVQSGISFENIKWIFTATVVGNWHPLTMFSHMLDWRLFGTNPAGHHFVGLLLHIGAVLFLFLFFYKTTSNLGSSAFAAAFLALHPLRVESVAWAAERKDVLSMFFGMACLYSYAFYAELPKLSKYFLCLTLFSLALMSKPMMVTLPFVLMLFDYWPLKRWQKALANPPQKIYLAGKLIWEKIPFIFLTITVSIITLLVQNKEGAIASLDNVPLFTRVANAIVSYMAYIEKTVWPVNIAIFYPYEFSVPLWKILVSGIIIILITIIIICYIRKVPFLFVGWFVYLGTLIPVIGLIQIGPQAMADRYMYLPSVGIVIMLAWGTPLLLPGAVIHKKILIPVGIVILIILTFLTWKQCGYWKNSVELYNHALKVTKDNYLLQYSLASALYQEGKIKESIDHYDKSILLKPDYVKNYLNRGTIYAKLGQYQHAIEDFNKAIDLKRDFADAYNNRGITYDKIGQHLPAIKDLTEAIRLKHDYADAYFNRGLVYAELGQYQQAIDDFNKTINLKQDYVEAYNNRGYVYFQQGNEKMGCYDAQKACFLGNCRILNGAKIRGYCR